nr:integumentary mucin C.1-like [Procambarus clarkii]
MAAITESACVGFNLEADGGSSRSCELSSSSSNCTSDAAVHFYFASTTEALTTLQADTTTTISTTEIDSTTTTPTTTSTTTTITPTSLTPTTTPPTVTTASTITSSITTSIPTTSRPTTSVATTPLPYTIELRFFAINKDIHCSGDHAITTVVITPRDSNLTTISYFICSKVMGVKFNVNDKPNAIVSTGSDSNSTGNCTNNMVLFELQPDSKQSFMVPETVVCKTLVNWNIDYTNCRYEYLTGTGTVWPTVSAMYTETWEKWISCLNFSLAVGLQREKVGSVWQIKSLLCCYIIYAPN